jgi:hypothetical protein
MQFAWKFARHRVPTILSHRQMNLSDKAKTQFAMPVFPIDMDSIAIYRSACKSRTLANKEHH